MASLPFLLEIKGIVQMAHLPTPGPRLRAGGQPQSPLSSGDLHRDLHAAPGSPLHKKPPWNLANSHCHVQSQP